jgi:hypothetical protein
MKAKLFIASLSLALCFAWTATASAQNLYSNGPINGTLNAWFIDSFQVSDSFVVSAESNLSSFTFGDWVDPGDVR